LETGDRAPAERNDRCQWAVVNDEPLEIGLDFGSDTVDNQVAHPDMYYFPEGFGPQPSSPVIGYNSAGHPDTITAAADTPRWKYWLALTPYPYGLGQYENPLLRVSNQRDSGWIRPYAIGDDPTDSSSQVDTLWVREPISTFPVFRDRESRIDPDTVRDEGMVRNLPGDKLFEHNSDPELVFDSAANRLVLIFRSTDDFAIDRLLAHYSFDGIDWNDHDTLLIATSPLRVWQAWDFLSPAVTTESAGGYYLWFVDNISLEGGTQLIRLTLDELGVPFVMAETCTVAIPLIDKQIWHHDIRRHPGDGRYYMLATFNPKNTSTHDTLGQFLYESRDGLDWEFVREVIDNSDSSGWYHMTYRSTLFFEEDYADRFSVWFNGISRDQGGHYVWKIGYADVVAGGRPGDINEDCEINILDITALIWYIYYPGERQETPLKADTNGDCVYNLLDITYLIRYIYMGGPAPLEPCSRVGHGGWSGLF